MTENTTHDSAPPTHFFLRGIPGDAPHRVELDRDPKVFAVRFKPGKRETSDGLSERTRRFLTRESRHVGFLAEHGLQIYEVESTVTERSEDTARHALRDLGSEASVDFATPAYRLRGERSDADPTFMTAQLVARFKSDVTRERIVRFNQEHDCRIVEPLRYANNAYLIEVVGDRNGDRVVEVANLYFESDLTEYAHPNYVRRRHRRVVTDPVHGRSRSSRSFRDQQWHLDKIRINEAWNSTRGSSATVIAILDDGVDTSHPEFGTKVVAQFDFQNSISDGRPKSTSDKHGTSVAGVAVASGVECHGAAPLCSLMAVRSPDYLGVADEAEMFRWVCDSGADVINCSWGPEDKTGAMDPLPDNVRDAIHYCVTQGRGGRGIPIFWAAGNGNESVSLDGYASNPEVIAVAACSEHDVRSPYSDFGPEIWICAPSSGDRPNGDRSIFTTDRLGSEGYNSGSSTLGDSTGDYTNDFGGTSSASPLAAGVGALVLTVNPQLTWEQVRNILRDTAVKIGNASGYSNGHSPEYGYGRIDAAAAVQKAQQAGGNGGTVPASPTGTPAIQAPSSWNRASGPPTFTVDPGAQSYYAVEVSASPASLDVLPSENSSGFYATYYDSAYFAEHPSGGTFTLSQSAWNSIKQNDTLYVRIWATSSSSGWENATPSTAMGQGSQAPSFQLGGAADSPAVPADGGGGTSSDTATTAVVTFPSGSTFDVVTTPGDGVDYSDSAGDGIVPLIEVRGRRGEQLSANFTVDEFAARDGASYARISVPLVEGLQRIRTRLDSPLTVRSGYRHPALNTEVGGARASRHMAGQAADIRASTVTPLELARIAIEELGCDIGIGLGASTIHVDVRGTRASWAYENAELSEAEFDDWVRQTCDSMPRRSSERRADVAPRRTPPQVEGPVRLHASDPAPAFSVRCGHRAYFGIELAARPELFDPQTAVERREDNWFASHEQGPLLLAPSGARSRVWELPEVAWQRLRIHSRLYYRVVSSPTLTLGGQVESSTPRTRLADAPSIEVTGGRSLREDRPAFRLRPAAEAREADRARS